MKGGQTRCVELKGAATVFSSFRNLLNSEQELEIKVWQFTFIKYWYCCQSRSLGMQAGWLFISI